jgi:hypothetical protein
MKNTLENENVPKYNKGQKVKTIYGIGIIKKIICVYNEKELESYVYKIKFNKFKTLLLFEEWLEEIK